MSLSNLLEAGGDRAAVALAGLRRLLVELEPGAILVCLDVEACAGPQGPATDPECARVVQLAVVEASLRPLPGGEADEPLSGDPQIWWREDCTLVDPVVEIDAESAAKHGVTDEVVAGAPRFADLAALVCEALQPSGGRRAVLVGYNAGSYDGPLLSAELRRAALLLRAGEPDLAARCAAVAAWLLEQQWADPLAVRRRAEPMDLGGSVRRYLGAELEGAHTADADASATLLLLGAQVACGHAASVEDAQRPSGTGAYDRAGKLLLDPGAEPRPEAVRYAIGKAKGRTVAEEPGFGRWMLTKDFPEETKRLLRGLLDKLPPGPGGRSSSARRR